MGSRREYLVNNIVRICHKLDSKGFGANHDGNVSARFEDKLLATPTSESKANIVPEMILTLDMQGNKLEGIGKPFSEIQLHLAAYRAREEANAVVHAHPPFSTARGLNRKSLRPAIPEAVISIGDHIPVTKFAMPGSPENEEIIMEALNETDLLLLAGNGVLSIGADVEQAYLRLELVEHIARIDYYATTAGEPVALSEGETALLLEKRAAAGLGSKKHNTSDNSSSGRSSDELEEFVIREITKILEDEF